MPATITKRLSERRWGWANPALDLVSPVLYAPLWRPDMLARGGRIVNGTGIATGSPLHLAVGANTVDVTQAGTFVVYMPEGGTVASGTMTVTASTVTVLAGIATTITTTGATGNIIVTPSNIIRSRDPLHHAMTVAGATWGSQGRYFDGTDDNISIPDAASLKTFAAGFGIRIWLNPAGNNMTNNGIFSKGAAETNGDYGLVISTNSKLVLMINNGSRAGFGATTITNTAKWYHIVGWYDLTNAKIFLDGVENATAAYSTAVATSATPLILGYYYTQDYDFQGTIGEVMIWSSPPSVSEIVQDMQKTKWRYKQW